ncbi:MAG: GNAT family N-acetyltransferase [Candidatus Bathyarchaeota archaeon]|nr:GNAT family N-acetyltransferase [Candidatus Bathyarchaeota archaeon]
MTKPDGHNLKMQKIGKSERLLFSFLGFRFFWNGADGNAIPMLPSNPAWLASLIVIPYMLSSLINVHDSGGVKYFIKEANEVVGTASLKVHQDTLKLQGLAVLPLKRKRGIGFFVLAEAEKFAKQMKLQWLEVEVLSGNVSAQRLYLKFGFKIYAKGRMALVFRKQI